MTTAPQAAAVEDATGGIDATFESTRPTGGTARPLWRLEWWRATRTHRLLAVLAAYLFFGVTAAPMTRYMSQLVERLGSGELKIVVPEPHPIDAFASYVSNTNQLGLLVFVMVISSALTFGAQREMAVFIRTRVRRPRDLVLPRYAVNTAIGAASFVIGVACTWFGTALLLGGVEAAGVVAATVLECVYLAFIGSVAALFGSRLNSTLTTAACTLAVALVLAIVGSFQTVGEWLPSRLLSALTTLPIGGDVSSFLRPTLVAIAASVALLAIAVRSAAAREH